MHCNGSCNIYTKNLNSVQIQEFMKLRKCSGVVIYRVNPKNDDFEVLLVKAEKFRDFSGELFYTIPGGTLDLEKDTGNSEEERMHACARREIKEEVSLDLESLMFLGKKRESGVSVGYNDSETNFLFYDFVGKGVGTVKINEELCYAQWHSFRDIGSISPMRSSMVKLILTIYQEREKYLQTFRNSTSSVTPVDKVHTR